MKPIPILLLLLAPFLLAGCLQSPNPFYTDADVFQDDRFLGDYRDAESKRGYLIQRDMDNRGRYMVRHLDGPKEHAFYESRFVGTLFRVGNKTFLDLYPVRDSGVYHVPGSPPTECEILRGLAYQPLHFIVRVTITDQGTAFSGLTTPNQFRALLQRDASLRQFASDEGLRPLNLPTLDLRKMLTKIAATDDVFPAPTEFKKPIPAKVSGLQE